MIRKVNALEAVADIQSGMPNEDLMKKYGLSAEELASLRKTLVATQLLKPTPEPGSLPLRDLTEPVRSTRSGATEPHSDSLPFDPAGRISHKDAKPLAGLKRVMSSSFTKLTLVGIFVIAIAVAALMYARLEKISNELDQTNRELNRISAEYEALRELQVPASAKDREIEKLRNENILRQQKITGLEAERQQNRAERNSLLVQARNQEEDISYLQSEVYRLDGEITKLKGINRGLTSENQKLQATVLERAQSMKPIDRRVRDR